MENCKKDPIIECPHCNTFIFILELNCKIFRHGVFIATGQQIDPHCPKELCEMYLEKGLIYGCGKPFRIIETGEHGWKAEQCDYI
jgi:hypothetical protein